MVLDVRITCKQISQRGFTIVELLIVIVIIGVLAALVIVAYNGIQQRANNTQRITAAKEWQRIIRLYLTENSAYPPGPMINNHLCLGYGQPTDWDTNSNEDCNQTTNIKHSMPANTANAFKTVATTLPDFPSKSLIIHSSGTLGGGLSLRAYDRLNPGQVDEKTYQPMLWFWLEGNDQDCVLRPVVVPVSGGYQITTNSNSGNAAGSTQCTIVLDHPSDL